ncbi:hypothetical protein CAPTEDRAFT_201217 [Capitella teleta]|uniref:Uncharacterized protein n=1 Tax=Capitella teleta TaxID=283909 RepID=R7U4K5_CAPTE|nr:hypothetical protein CAPTEDRAFT_201217 [Capitella teleta]|eukprot:ELU01295.1 hypothetical protein CAPTEDRAFT_201217 [Capitella teleta]
MTRLLLLLHLLLLLLLHLLLLYLHLHLHLWRIKLEKKRRAGSQALGFLNIASNIFISKRTYKVFGFDVVQTAFRYSDFNFDVHNSHFQASKENRRPSGIQTQKKFAAKHRKVKTVEKLRKNVSNVEISVGFKCQRPPSTELS